MWTIQLSADGIPSETVPARDREELCALLEMLMGVVAALVDDHHIQVDIKPAETPTAAMTGERPCLTCAGTKVIDTDRPGATSPRPCPACATTGTRPSDG